MNDVPQRHDSPYRIGYRAAARYRVGDQFLGALNEPALLEYPDQPSRIEFAAGYEAAIARRYPDGILIDPAGRLLSGKQSNPAGGVRVRS